MEQEDCVGGTASPVFLFSSQACLIYKALTGPLLTSSKSWTVDMLLAATRTIGMATEKTCLISSSTDQFDENSESLRRV